MPVARVKAQLSAGREAQRQVGSVLVKRGRKAVNVDDGWREL